MGLDNFWIIPPAIDSHPDFDPPLNLCGGLFSSHGSKSFRGKVYAEFCQEIMHINLYDDVIESAQIDRALVELNDYIKSIPPDQQFSFSKYNLTFEELLDLQRMFTKYAELGAKLESWY